MYSLLYSPIFEVFISENYNKNYVQGHSKFEVFKLEIITLYFYAL